MVAEAERLAAPLPRKLARDPGIVAQRLVDERSLFDRAAVTAGKSRLAVDEPVAQPPRRRARRRGEVAADAQPIFQRQLVRQLQAGARGSRRSGTVLPAPSG